MYAFVPEQQDWIQKTIDGSAPTSACARGGS
jgi:hypothetical protein